jgi:hypothetical protein
MHDAWIFIGALLFIFIIWVATGGPTHPLSFAGPELSLPGVLGGGTYISLPRAPFSIGNSDIELPDSSNGGSVYTGSNTGSNSSIPSSASLDGVAFGSPSPYRGIVTLDHSIYDSGASNPGEEYIEISVQENAGVPVDITGWTLESGSTGNAAVIPQGTKLPTSGTVNAGQDIVLNPGDSALVISGISPIGASFEENKCIAYYSNFQTFYPELPNTCPEPSSELATYYSNYIRDNTCITYVNTLSRCQAVLSPPPTVSGSCQAFLIKYLNYNGCVTAHQSDSDFEGTTWRVYLGRTSSMWRNENEVVKLLDANGKTVDAFSY